MKSEGKAENGLFIYILFPSALFRQTSPTIQLKDEDGKVHNPTHLRNTRLENTALKQWFLTMGYSGVLDCNSQKPSPPTVLAGVSGSCSSKTSE